MQIKGHQKTTLLDYPGKIATIFFTPGCNFRCGFCHNKDLVLDSPDLPQITEEEIFKFLKKRKKLTEGVVISGGEPTLQKDLTLFIKKIKSLGFCVKLDTNGANPAVLKQLIDQKLIDYIAMDIKGPLDARYEKIVGVGIDLGKIRLCIKLIKESGIDYEFRTTVVPTLHTKKDLVDMAKQIEPVKLWYLQQFLPQNTINANYREITPYDKLELEEILKKIQKIIPEAKIR